MFFKCMVFALILSLTGCFPSPKKATGKKTVETNEVALNCSGSSIKTCTVVNGVFNTGTMNSTCSDGIWSAPYSTCKISSSANDCLDGFYPSSELTSCVPSDCNGSSTTSCTVQNGRPNTGQRSRTCNQGTWGAPYGDCKIATSSDCNSGYIPSGDMLSCVAHTCQGDSFEACTVQYGQTNSGTRSRTCNQGIWGSPYGSCLIQNESDCLSGYIPRGDMLACVTAVCSGNNYITCTVPNGIADSGRRTMTCNSGSWGAPFGTCTLYSSEGCLNGYIPNSNNTACLLETNSIISGTATIRNSMLIQIGAVSISWSKANQYFGYFYPITEELNFADISSSWFPGYLSYNGIDTISEFTSTSGHTFTYQTPVLFADSLRNEYRGILLFRYNNTYGAIKPIDIYINQSDGLYYLNYEYWYDPSGGSDFSDF